MQDFFTRGRQDGRGQQVGMTQVNQGREDRSFSASKRLRTQESGEFQERRPRRHGGRQPRPQAPVIKGTSAQFAELAGPVTFWVGRCRPELSEERIKEIITKNAESCEVKDFMVESVKCLTKDPNPWTKSFKVSVPARFEEVMSNAMMYLPTWEARPFTPWPGKQMQGHPASQQGLRVEAAATALVAGEAPQT